MIVAFVFAQPEVSTLWLGNWDGLFDMVERSGPWVGLVLVLLMILHNVVPIPAEMIAICAGATCGLAYGVLVIWVGAVLGAVLAFWVARRYGRAWLMSRRWAGGLRKLDKLAVAGSWRGLLAARLLPLISFNLVNYGAGLADVRWSTFLWTTAVGILPITVVSVAAGAGMRSLSGWQMALLGGGLCCLLVLSHLLRRRAG